MKNGWGLRTSCAGWYFGTAPEPGEADWCCCVTAPPPGWGPGLGPPCWQSGRLSSAEMPKKPYSGYVMFSPVSEVMLRLVRAEQRCDLCGCLGAAYPPMASGSLLLSSADPLWDQATDGLFLFSPSQKKQWDGHKGPVWMKREVDCQSKPVSWWKWEWQVQNVLTRVCWWLFVGQS